MLALLAAGPRSHHPTLAVPGAAGGAGPQRLRGIRAVRATGFFGGCIFLPVEVMDFGCT